MDAFGNLVSVVEPDPSLGNVTTNYTYDVLNHLTQVSMPRGRAAQTRTFNYNSGTTVTGFLQSATNPENGTVTYTYNASSLLASKTDAKGQHFTYQYDTYNRLTSLTWTNSPTGAQVLRTYMYDTNTLDGTFSGYYTAGRLVAVQNAQFTPGNGSIVRWIQMVEMYGYTQAGSVSGKRLQVNESLNGTTSSARNLDALYTYTNEGKVASVNYPTTWSTSGSTAGPTYTYGFDGMSRPITLTDQNNNVDVTGVTYNAANQLLSVTYFDQAESRVYNSLGQLTQLSSTGAANINYSYNFPAGANNGKIGSSYNAVTGETIAYQYDSLNRLISAAGSGWGDAYGFDGFGNLLSKTVTAGSAPSLSQAVNSANNQIVGQGYDANGNQTSPPNNSGELLYDAENRLTQNGVSVQYAYDSQNKRVWVGTLVSGSLTSQSANLYGIDGQMLGTYSLSASTSGITDPATSLSVYFGRKRVAIVAAGVTTPFVQDRLGSNMSWQVNRVSLYPWGEDRGTPAVNDQVKFATYTRDSATLLDYADNRYYSNAGGRFMTPDLKGGYLTNPGSLNRYTYAVGDPVNSNDPSGLCSVMISGITMGPGSNAEWSAEAASLGSDTAYPYSEQGTTSSIGSVTSQLTGPNAATYTAYYQILAAEASSSSPVDIVAYSGGAGAFAAAWKLLTSAQQADIGTILYLAPGSAGATLPSNGSTYTYVGGFGPVNGIAGAGTSPVGTVRYTDCSHTDLGCFFGNAAGPLGNIASDGNCYPQSSLTLQQTTAYQAALVAEAQQIVSSLTNINYYMAGAAPDLLDLVDLTIPQVTSTISYP